MTEESFLQDSYESRFEANVLACMETELGTGVILDRTCFYPGGGGQPADSGTLSGAEVLAVSRQAANIVHHCDRRLDGRVLGVIDWQRRFDHMQQHTGQHVLSAALLRLHHVETRSFHLGPSSCSIQLDAPSLDSLVLDEAEALANQAVWDNREVRATFEPTDEASSHDIRGTIPARDLLRVVEVEGFDRVACGGTHLRRTGEIGLIKILAGHREGNRIRLDFLCGMRALRDYAQSHLQIIQLANSLATDRKDLLATAARVKERQSRDRDRIRLLSGQLMAQTIPWLLEKARIIRDIRIVCHIFTAWDVEDVCHLVRRLQQQDHCVALVGVKSEKAHLIFARSKDLAFDIRIPFASALAIVGGRGGGSPEFAQGAAPSAEKLEVAVHVAQNALLPSLPAERTP